MKRAIDLRGAVSINVITMIGIGPLVTIPLVIAALGGPLALVGWIAGAIVALCDGMVWAELSSQFPGSGGTYVYLRNIFGARKTGKGARLPLQLAVPLVCAVPFGQRIYRLRELRCLSVSAAANGARPRPRRHRDRLRYDRPALPAHVASLGFERIACGSGDRDRRVGCRRGALTRRLYARVSLEPADPIWRRACSPGLGRPSTSHSMTTWVMPTWRCSATKSSGRGAQFRFPFCSRCWSSRSSTCSCKSACSAPCLGNRCSIHTVNRRPRLNMSAPSSSSIRGAASPPSRSPCSFW